MNDDDLPLRLRFGVFEADLRSGELSKSGARVHLTDKPFQLLVALLERPGELVTRQELRGRMWSENTFVDFDNNLNAAVRKLREALGDSADSPRFVETLPRRGYRFLAEVSPVDPVSVAASTAAGEPAAAVRPRAGRRRIVAVAVLALAAVAVAVAMLVPREDEAPVATRTLDGRQMLVVMPFVDLDSRPDRQYFVDGLTEEMITQLGRLQPERLGVIARTSSMQYRNTDKKVDVIGSELGVDYLLEGSVRSSGGRVRITSQLIQTSDQTHLWAETYDVELNDLLQVQGNIAVQVAGELALELLPDEPLAQARAGTRITAAYEAFLRGRYEWNTFSGERYPEAIRHFEHAIALDPSYAAAWAALADTYNLQSFTSKTSPTDAYTRAREAALRGLEFDDGSAMAHNALAFVLLYNDYDLAGANREFRRAIELAPNYAMAYHWWAGALAALERHDDALRTIQRAVELDPVSLSVLSDVGWYYLFANRYEEGIAECRRILETQDYGWARACIFHGLVAAGRHDEALDEVRHAWPELESEFAGQPADAVLRALSRRRAEEKLKNDELRERYPMELAFDFAAAGDADAAFGWLEQAWQLRDQWLVFLEVDPRFDALSGDPRYAELAERIGLP